MEFEISDFLCGPTRSMNECQFHLARLWAQTCPTVMSPGQSTANRIPGSRRTVPDSSLHGRRPHSNMGMQLAMTGYGVRIGAPTSLPIKSTRRVRAAQLRGMYSPSYDSENLAKSTSLGCNNIACAIPSIVAVLIRFDIFEFSVIYIIY